MLVGWRLQEHLGGKSYCDVQDGKIGIALNIEYLAPLTSNPVDVAAANYGLEKNLGWFADPLFFGTYCMMSPSQQALIVGIYYQKCNSHEAYAHG